MPLEIHEKLEVRILEALEKALPNIQIKNGMFLDASSRIHICRQIMQYQIMAP